MHKGRVALVGFRHQPGAGAQSAVGIRTHQATADHEGRILAGFTQHAGDQAGRRGLAVGSGDCDGLPEAHELGQHLRAPNHRLPGGAGGFDFRIGRIDRAGNHHDIGVLHVLRAMPDLDAGAEGAQATRDRRLAEIRTLHLVTQVQEYFGDAAHADAANADKMNPVYFAHAVFHEDRLQRMQVSATARVASGWASARAARDRLSNSSRLSAQQRSSSARRAGVSSDCGSSTAAPASVR